ncbi:MAG: CsgG/HfaB family protein [Synergistaceae bacterium]|nr:CsgG/HfaB family protein [Synergistaceae bacterium]
MKRFISCFVFLLLLIMCATPAMSAQSDRIRIGVLGFESKAHGVSQRQAEIITDIFTRQLANSKTIAVYEREQLAKVGSEIKLSMSGLVDMNTAIEVGRIVGVRYILLGSVTELSQKASGGFIPIMGIGIGGTTSEARATIDVRIIDTETSEIRLALSETGLSSSSSSAVSFQGVTFAESEFGGLEARAIADATNRLAHQIRSILGGESSHVVSMSSDGVVIDVGSTMGAKEGSLYLVYADGKTIRGMNDEIIGQEKISLAVIKVKEVSGAHSTCTVAPPSDSKMIRRGDKIEPITAAKAKNMKFATSRPAASSGTFEQLFGDGGAAGSQPATKTGNATDDRLAQISGGSSYEQPAVTPVRSGGRREIPGFDPDNSTDAKVIQTYDMDPGDANMLGIRHRNAMNKYNGKKYNDAYADFCELAEEYSGNYLDAYWAGVAAEKLKKKDESLEWIDFALSINPDYKPAAEFKRKTLKK